MFAGFKLFGKSVRNLKPINFGQVQMPKIKGKLVRLAN